MQNRQADAAISAALLDLKAKAAALSFRSHQDALDYAAHSVEHVNCLLAANSVNAVDRYAKGHVSCYARLHSRRSNRQGDLVFFGIPAERRAGRADGVACPSVAGDIAGKESDCPIDLQGNKGAMFLGVTELVQGPEGVIPSFVWIEPAKERRDFRWQIGAGSPSTVDVVVEVTECVCEGEVGL